MAAVLHRTTKEYRASVSTPDFPTVDWIHNPDLSAVTGQPSKYWLITGDFITLMDKAARDVVDAAELSSGRDAVSDQIDLVEDIVRALALTLLDELNNHAAKINAILDAADNATSLATFKADMVAITDYPQRTISQLKTTIRNKLGS
tara:strand:+ start:12743 stop:13183 length:441 start_codon:yes stop_codon:yes gene_type:complete